MLLTVFENNYFLLALSWGIINSFWQAGLLWFVYKITTFSSKAASALFRYHLGLLLLSIAFAWFVVTTVQGYLSLQGSGIYSFTNISLQWPLLYQKFNTAFQLLSCAYLVLLFLNGIKFFHRFNNLLLLKNSQFIKAPADIRIFVNKTAAHLGIKRKVEVWISKKVDVPCITGYFKPLILLPFTTLNNISTSQAEAILLHELAHIKRNDYLVNLVQSFMELILFFNPFAMLLGKAARKERENCCDDWVLNYQYSKHDYAAALMVLEQQRQFPVQLALAATSGKKQLLTRIKRLFTTSPVTDISIWQRVRLAGIGCISLLTLMMFLPGIQTEQSLVNAFTRQPEKILNNPKPALITGNEAVKFKKIVNDNPLPPALAAAAKKAKANKAVDKSIKEIEYAEALINEELLTANTALQNLSIQVADNEETPVIEYLVKIEEENSGSKEKKSYLLQYKNINGQFEIKPLIMLNKTKTLSTKAKAKKLTSSSTLLKKKITS